ncbi:hypothetical protein GGP86_002707 [Salinibacter ruber]|nr:hypothetical protein [Salinibacter ruber]
MGALAVGGAAEASTQGNPRATPTEERLFSASVVG